MAAQSSTRSFGAFSRAARSKIDDSEADKNVWRLGR